MREHASSGPVPAASAADSHSKTSWRPDSRSTAAMSSLAPSEGARPSERRRGARWRAHADHRSTAGSYGGSNRFQTPRVPREYSKTSHCVPGVSGFSGVAPPTDAAATPAAVELATGAYCASGWKGRRRYSLVAHR